MQVVVIPDEAASRFPAETHTTAPQLRADEEAQAAPQPPEATETSAYGTSETETATCRYKRDFQG